MGVSQDLLRVSVIIVVSGGGEALPALLSKIDAYTHPSTTHLGSRFQVEEVLLVRDQGPGPGDRAIHALAQQNPWVRPVWLSRNFGRQAATIAGMTSAGGQWIVTMSEQGCEDPSLIPVMLDAAYEKRAQLVYGPPAKTADRLASESSGPRFLTGLLTRLLASDLPSGRLVSTSEYRLVLGEVGRSVAAYAGPGINVDGALEWVVSTTASLRDGALIPRNGSAACALPSTWVRVGRRAASRESQPLRAVSLLGALSILVALALFVWLVCASLTGASPNIEWMATLIALALIGGVLLLGLGTLAQYAQAAANMSFGKPLFIIVSDPSHSFPENTTPTKSVNDEP